MHERTLGASLPSVAALAFLGDAEYSRFVRRMLIDMGYEKAGELNRMSLLYVTAERQAALARRLRPMLTEDEEDVFRRASNISHPNRPKHASVADYRLATGLEALLGMLSYIGDTERTEEIFSLVRAEFSPEQQTENHEG